MAPTPIRAAALGLSILAACHSPRTTTGATPVLPGAAPAPVTPAGPGSLTPRLSPPPALAEVSDLDALVDLALWGSPALAASRAEAEARAAAVGEAGSLPEPRVTWTEFLEPVETRVGPQDRTLMVQQALPWGGAREAQRETARAAARTASAAVADAEAAVRAAVEATAWRRARARALAELEREGVELLAAIHADVDARYRTGDAEFPDLLRAADEVALAEERVAAAEDRARRETAALEAAVGLGPLADLELALSPAPEGLAEDLGRRIDEAASPALAALDHGVAGARAAERGLAYERRSDLAVGVFLAHVDPRTDAGAPPDNGQDALGLQLSFTLPIRADRYDAAEDAARHRVRAARARRAAAEETLRRDLTQALEDLGEAERRIDLYAGRLVASAAETLEAQRAAYASGRATFTDLTLAARRQLELEAELVRARCDRELARIAIERHLGTPTER